MTNIENSRGRFDSPLKTCTVRHAQSEPCAIMRYLRWLQHVTKGHCSSSALHILMLHSQPTISYLHSLHHHTCSISTYL